MGEGVCPSGARAQAEGARRRPEPASVWGGAMAGKVTPMAKYKLVFLGDQSVRCLRVAAPDLLCYVCVFVCVRARAYVRVLWPFLHVPHHSLSVWSALHRWGRRRSSRASCTTSSKAATR